LSKSKAYKHNTLRIKNILKSFTTLVIRFRKYDKNEENFFDVSKNVKKLALILFQTKQGFKNSLS